jgi:protease PrsW
MPLIYAFLFGFLPPILWLLFWLREDKKHPEPRGRIFLTFITGALMVVPAFFLESLTKDIGSSSLLLMLVIWALIEEGLKFGAAHFSAIKNRALADEPIDIMIYLVTAALGFAAAENVLFLFEPFQSGALAEAFATGSLRFIGATVLHTVTSGILGGVVAFSFFKRKYIYIKHVVEGIILAILLHTLFNLFIINLSGINLVVSFVLVWIGVVGLIFLFERIKKQKH